jgi:hypothetical protein
MDHFDDCGELAGFQGICGGQATESGGEQHEDGPKLFPLKATNVSGDILDEAAGAAELATQYILNKLEFRPEEVGELLFQLSLGGFSDGHGGELWVFGGS